MKKLLLILIFTFFFTPSFGIEIIGKSIKCETQKKTIRGYPFFFFFENETNVKSFFISEENLIKFHNLNYKDVLYIGDGFVDIPVMEKVGFSISVPNAHAEVKEYADFITKKSGGQGVLVEIAKHILKSKNIYDAVFERMRKEIYNG